MAVRVLIGDALTRLRDLPAASVHCCVTSPPYYGLRDYGVDGQIGLEETPDAFVSRLVEVFREVRRVLRDDGTLWLNIGDSYVGSWGAQGRTGQMADRSVVSARQIAAHPRKASRTGSIPSGSDLKPKDLLGIPWRVAFALQQSWYAGQIARVEDRIWLAAMIDGEGCMFIHRRKAGQDSGAKWTDGQGVETSYRRTKDTFGSGIEVANTSLALVERCQQIAGCGSICKQEKDRRQPLYRWTARSTEAKRVAQEVYPHLVAKQHQARIVFGCPSSGERAASAHAALKDLHAGKPSDVDFPVPPSLHEPGWYLRQDVIWSKPNPMPESVRDRCTKAHEYIFMLSKSPRYYFDVDAIKEDAKTNDPRRPYTSQGAKELDGRTEWKSGERRDGNDFTKRNRRSVWTVSTRPYSEAHFATFPPDLPELCIKAGCPEGGTVIDPFFGAGTTGLVADRLGRDCIGIELNPEYAALAQRRIEGDAGMFAKVDAA